MSSNFESIVIIYRNTCFSYLIGINRGLCVELQSREDSSL